MRLGVKAALADADSMAALEVDFLEVHLGLDDLTRRRDALVATFGRIRRERGLGMVVHAPEFMGTATHPALVDLASPDPSARAMSVGLLERTVELAGAIDAGLIVAHPGGIVPEGDAAKAGAGGVERLGGSLDRLRDAAEASGALLTLENMPWFYYVKSDQTGTGRMERWASTLLVDPEGFDPLAGLVDGLTLDGFLHTPKGGMEVIEGFLSRHGERVLHLHISDARPPDHEGLQLGEGSVDIRSVLRAVVGRDVTAVPEIIGGHRRGGLGFARALEVIRRILDEVGE
jgi:sugar phosphate isomerase/epimerase